MSNFFLLVLLRSFISKNLNHQRKKLGLSSVGYRRHVCHSTSRWKYSSSSTTTTSFLLLQHFVFVPNIIISLVPFSTNATGFAVNHPPRSIGTHSYSTFSIKPTSRSTARMKFCSSNDRHKNSESVSWNPNIFSDLSTEIVRHYVPTLSAVTSYKGSSGRIGILGGSERYTGAPYYAAMASLKVGADLAFVFCAREAAIPIKCYSPELMVTSVYTAEEFGKALLILDANKRTDASTSAAADPLVHSMVAQVTSMFDRMHVLIVGPGLGRCPLVMRATAEIIRQAISYGLPLVLDADALYLLTQEPYKDLLNEDVSSPRDKTQQPQQQQQQRTIILTPNAVELKRLKEAIEECSEGEERKRVQESYHGVIVVQKGQYDNIFFFSSLFSDDSLGTSRNNTIPPAAVMICKEEGGLKRSGGLGDILSGSIGTFLAWHQLMMKKQNNPSSTSDDISQLVLTGKEKLVPCWAACCIVKLATKAAYYKKRRAMTAPDVLEEIGEVVDKAITSHFD